MKRHTITEGATTTAGGKIIGASSQGTIDGARIALENDPIYCPACNSAGHIACVGARISEIWNEKQVALENDLCICQCHPHPRMVPCQAMRYQDVSDDAGDILNVGHDGTSLGAYDQHFHIKDEAGRALIDVPYVIELSNGQRFEGRTDQEGKTVKVETSTAEHATLIVYAQETTPLNPTWDR